MLAFPGMDAFVQDLRYAVRTLSKSPGFLTVAVLSLGLGIGANTAIFSLIHALMLRMLPVADPERLFLLTDPGAGGVMVDTRETGVRELLSVPEFEQLRKHNDAFSGLFAAQSELSDVNVFASRRAEERSIKAHAQLVSGGFFGVLGVRSALGRVFTPEEDRTRGASPVAVISYGFWQRAFAGDPTIIGKAIRVGPATLQIIGVTSPGFRGMLVGSDTDLWAPLTMQQQLLPGRDYLTPQDTLWLQVMGRLAPGMSAQRAQAAVNVQFQQILRWWAARLPNAQDRRKMLKQRILLRKGALGASELRDQFSDALVMLLAITGMVLLIACANIANLMLARATGRQREFGVRLALGAARARLVRQVFTESLVLAALGGIVGMLLAGWGTRLLLTLVSSGGEAIQLDVQNRIPVFAFTAAVSLLTGIGFGIVPALRSTRVELNRTLTANARGSVGGRGRAKTGRVLAIAQVSLSLVLVIGAALFVRSLRNMLSEKLGFNRDRIVMVDVDAIGSGYNGASAMDLYRSMLQRLGAVPGIRAVSLSNSGLFDGDSGDPVAIEGSPIHNPDDLHARWTLIGPSYFATLGVPVLNGRELTYADAGRASPVCVVNAAFARYYFPGLDPIGRHLTDEYPTTRETYEIVGVVADVKEHHLDGQPSPRFYGNLFHPIGTPQSVTFLISGFGKPVTLFSAIRRIMAEVDPPLPILDIRTLNEQIGRRTTTQRLIAELSAFFGGLALSMAAIGLYGLLSYTTARRTSEIGVRMALGASETRVLWMVLGETLSLVLAGVCIGVPSALAAGRLISHQLFGVTPSDPTTIAAAILIISAAAVLAGYVPARRAARISPMSALRND